MRKNLIVTAAATAILLGSMVPVAADTWSGAYDNTIVSSYDDGHVVDVYVESDHTYTIVPRDGSETIEGTWSDANGQSCFTIVSPASYAGGEPLCFELRDYKVGDIFEGSDSTGHFTAEIVAGRN